MLNWSTVLEQLPKEVNAEPGKAVKFFLGFLLVGEKWHTLSLVTQTLFKVQIEKKKLFQLGCSWWFADVL